MQTITNKHVIANAYSSGIHSRKSDRMNRIQTDHEQELRIISDIDFLKKFCQDLLRNSQIYHWKYFHELKITLIRISLDKEIFSLLSLLFRGPLSLLTKFKLSLILSLEMDDNKLELVGSHTINHLKCLKSLSFHFVYCPEITDKGLKSLISQISKNSQRLEAFKLRIKAWDKITDKGVRSLGTRIMKSSHLKRLILNFNTCPGVSEATLQMIANNLEYLKENLYKLSLGFTGCSKITDKGFIILGSKLSFVLKNLEKLKLVFGSGSEITDDGFEGLFSSLKYDLPRLKVFTLNLNCPNLTNTAIENFAKSTLKHLVSLTSLELSFQDSKIINDKAIKALAVGIVENLESLSRLSLDFSHSPGVGDESLKILSDQIASKLHNLKDFRLKLLSCTTISGVGMKALGDNLKMMKSLESFDLKTGGLNQILHQDKDLLRKELDFIHSLQIV